MRVPYLPETMRAMLSEHELKQHQAAAKGQSAGPFPIWVYRPLNFPESQEWAAKGISAETKVGSSGAVLGELFVDRVIKVENLTIGDEDEPFNAKDPRHVNAIDPSWITEIGLLILNRAHLSEETAGKSSSPSS